ncbi:phage tail protein [Sphingomonas morindae]|uniref:Phage tail protein n=1 Tax=Sphingomonas morindae TaxID=1541170 RepID=A0ABY4X702_9SPHN|nr:phage tail protein [Sphingomonas morindae]USI72697.1 phage tail protein [Sphingomonas morindae]
MALLSLGLFAFELATLAYDELQRRSEWRFARTPRVGARDAVQFVGPGDDTITLSGAVYQAIADGRVSLDTLRAMADQGEAAPLVCAAGTVYGDFVLERLDERHTDFWPDGTPRRIDFSIDLARVTDGRAPR